METICFRIENDLLKRIDLTVKKYNYKSRSEFIREAIRKKLKRMNIK